MSFLLGFLGDHVDFSNGKSSPERQGKAEFPVYGSNGIIGFSNQYNAPGHVSIIGRVGTYCGSIHFSKQPCWVTDNAIKAIAKNTEEARFWHYAMLNCDLHDLRAGSGQPLINQSALKKVSLSVPPKSDRWDIAGILGALDDKIEVNRKTAVTLEAMARSLYRSWFVDFDPVWAKLEGRAPAHMDPATAALFPDSFGDDGVPEGWEMGSVSDVFDVTMGQSPPGETYNEDGNGLPFYQGRTEFGFRFPTLKKYCSAPTRVARRDSVLLSVRAPVGDLNRAWEECCIGRGVASLWEKSGCNAYGYEAVWALSEALSAFESEGTVFGAINKQQLADLAIILPPSAVKEAYQALVVPFDEKIRAITAELQTLAALRDSLLPRLMSGQLRVDEAREQIEEVA